MDRAEYVFMKLASIASTAFKDATKLMEGGMSKEHAISTAASKYGIKKDLVTKYMGKVDNAVDPIEYMEQGMKLTKNDTLSKVDDVATNVATNVAGAAEDGTQATKKVVDYEKLYKDTNKKRIAQKDKLERSEQHLDEAYDYIDDLKKNHLTELAGVIDNANANAATAKKYKNLAIGGGAAGTVGLGVGAYGLLSNRDKVKKSA